MIHCPACQSVLKVQYHLTVGTPMQASVWCECRKICVTIDHLVAEMERAWGVRCRLIYADGDITPTIITRDHADADAPRMA